MWLCICCELCCCGKKNLPCCMLSYHVAVARLYLISHFDFWQNFAKFLGATGICKTKIYYFLRWTKNKDRFILVCQDFPSFQICILECVHYIHNNSTMYNDFVTCLNQNNVFSQSINTAQHAFPVLKIDWSFLLSWLQLSSNMSPNILRASWFLTIFVQSQMLSIFGL